MQLTQTFLIASCFLIVVSCNNKRKIPDVSSIKIDLTIERFEQKFIALDTNNLDEGFDTLYRNNPDFFPYYLYQVLALTQHPPQTTMTEAKLFLRDSLYKTIYKDVQKEFINLDKEKQELELALKLCKHYFPKYKTPTKLLTYIGPVTGYGAFIANNHVFAIGLQSFLGKDYSVYQTGYVMETYAGYQTRRFERQYIATNCITNLLADFFADESSGKPLNERMIEQGKRWYILDALLPNTADTIKTGYSQGQLQFCRDNEKGIWAFFVKGNLLFEREPSIVKPFVTDGPKTQEISEASPGNIGTYIGWRIVKKWMDEHKQTTLEQLMKTPATTIFNESSYNP